MYKVLRPEVLKLRHKTEKGVPAIHLVGVTNFFLKFTNILVFVVPIKSTKMVDIFFLEHYHHS